MFATPEEMLGRRVIRDDVIWEEHLAPTEFEAFSREFTSWDCDFGTKFEGQRDMKNSQNKNVKAAAPPVQMRNEAKPAEKAGPQANSRTKRKADTSGQGHNGHGIEKATVQEASLALSRVQNKRKGKKVQQSKPQDMPASTKSKNADGRDAGNTASEIFPQSEKISAKKRSRSGNKKKASSKKVVDGAINLDAKVNVYCRESGAQKTAYSPLSPGTGSKGEVKDDSQSPKATSSIITSKMEKSETNGSHPEPRQTVNTKASVQECV